MSPQLTTFAVLLSLGLCPAGCFSPSYVEPPFQCTVEWSYACPDGYTCVRGSDPSTGVCTRNGTHLDGGVGPDGSVARDAARPGDTAPPPDAPPDAGRPPDAPTQTDAPVCRGAAVVISQVYGGGGSAGAPYQNDFIELLNRGATPIDVSAWSVQYAAATGTSWSRTNLTGTIAAGGYLLVQEASSSGCSSAPCGSALPSPDVTGTLNLSASSGKVALVSSQTALTGSCPTAGIVDLVGYGTASCFQGAAAAPLLDATTAGVRGGAGCTDDGNSSTDFTATAPTPRSRASASHGCPGC